MRAPRLPDALLDPRIYPHATDDLRLVETHVSWIALAGPYAYKLKKPVRFEFLDYSTRDRRRGACETDLALNRRWAPALYLDLQVLPDDESTPRWQPASAGGEPAVRMARFDRDEELDVLVARERVAADELAALGRDLAGWHATAPVDTAGNWGGAAEALRAALDNFDALRAAPAPFDVARLAALEARVRREHAALAPWFDARRNRGQVRECHGDLHTRNVVRLGGRLVPFDAIDFAPRLRWIDVAADAAFLAMDLERLGRDDLAHAFLDAWLAADGDYDAATGMGWLVAYRALVRAKVDALRATQLGAGREAAAAWRECEGFVALAERRLAPRRGRVYATTGVSGSGKSWLAARLVPALPAIRVRSDVERRRLAGLSPLAPSGSPPDGRLYARGATLRTYERLRTIAGTLVDAGYDVIVDATHLDGERRGALDALAAGHRTTLAWLECTAPEAVLRRRVSARTGDPSEATVTILERQFASRMPLTPAESARAVRIDTSRTVDAAGVAAALRVAAARPGGSTPASAPAS
jgi:aminoglycoside phosphotransferase family enzyme/predicted kinase